MRETDIQVKYKYSRGSLADAIGTMQNDLMNLARIRKTRGLTQIDLAEMCGVTQPTISRAERGDDGVTLGTYRACARALDVNLVDLFASDQTATENILLAAFRRLNRERQKGWLDMARAATAEPDTIDQ